MRTDKEKILENLCYTELVYGRINKKLKLDLSNNAIEEFIMKILKETEEANYSKTGKNFYVMNCEYNIRVTVTSNTFRVITVDRVGGKMV